MGYNYTAGFTIHVSEASAIAMSLDTERLHADIQQNRFSWDLPEDLLTNSDIVASLFEVLDFELNDKGDDELIDAQQQLVKTKVYNGYVDTKMNTNVDIILNWMATHGVGIDMHCQGEDDALWQYSSAVNGGSLKIDEVDKVARNDLDRLKAAEATINRLLTVYEQTPTLPALAAVLDAHKRKQGI